MTEKEKYKILLREAVGNYLSSKLDPLELNAITTAVITVGVELAPKAAAIQAWSESIVEDYAGRKEQIDSDTFDGNYDFSNHGNLPFDFLEAFEEAKNARDSG